MNETMTDQLLAGYTAYTSAEDFGSVSSEAPGITPSVLSAIAASTAACGALISGVSGASVATTKNSGC
ncbi:hypothetical protein E0L36_22595 [Streptomyces sp. AJS327]|uniref:LxmA leader domain family RiPP n=1 Tax=Streptomyces sp. AJS327 TaxID=2545265 RepID=UPI0015DECE9B|nr:LxmA leader domain family RiPP [Streptomyces sp. AJS327]MBA0053562.1 hypothetical protein [Streptomyces sp. AJS327]MBA0053563.1 hypothetical protein [Streptomyces sp. AJS327]